MIEKKHALVYNYCMSINNGTKRLNEDLIKALYNEQSVSLKGFRKRKNGDFSTFSDRKMPKKIIVIESEKDGLSEKVFASACFLKKLIAYFGFSEVGIKISPSKIHAISAQKKRVLALSFNEEESALVRRGTNLGACNIEISPYKKSEKM